MHYALHSHFVRRGKGALKEYARQMISIEELHAGEVDMMLRHPDVIKT